MRKRTTDLTNSSSVDQLCAAVLAKLEQHFSQQLTLNQQVQGSILWRLTTAFI